MGSSSELLTDFPNQLIASCGDIELMSKGDGPSLRDVVDKLDKHVRLATQSRQIVRIYNGSLDGVPSLFGREDTSCMAGSTSSTTMTTDPADPAEPETRSTGFSSQSASQNPYVRRVCSCGRLAFGLLSLACAGAIAGAARQMFMVYGSTF